MPFIFMLRFCEIRYEGSARIAEHLSIEEFYNARCEKGLKALWCKFNII
jgi:hypothetical protein